MSKKIQAIWWFLLAYLLLHVVIYFAATQRWLSLFSLIQHRLPMVQVTVLFLIQEVIIILLFYVVWRSVTWQTWYSLLIDLRERRQWKGRGYVGIYVGGWLLLYFIVNAILLSLITYLGRDIPGLYGEQIVINLLTGLSLSSWREWFVIGLLVVVVWPVIEELLFRGVVTHVFMKQRAFQGVFLAALLFAAAHAERAVVWNLVILSLFLGYIYRKTGSMRYSFLFHFGINWLAMLILVLSSMYSGLIPN